jgi:phosphoglycolate phosphatase
MGGARMIAVATGKSSADDLRKAGADHVLPDLTDLDSLRRTLHELWHSAATSHSQ